MADWKACGYISLSKNKSSVVIMIATTSGEKKYYVSDIQETLDVLTGRLAYAKIYEKR